MPGELAASLLQLVLLVDPDHVKLIRICSHSTFCARTPHPATVRMTEISVEEVFRS